MPRAPLTRPLALVLALALLPGCRGPGLKIAMATAIIAAKTVQLAAAASRSERPRLRRVSTGGSSAPLEGCGRCPEPDDGYAVCFVSTCEIRCVEGYVLEGDRCVQASSAAAP